MPLVEHGQIVADPWTAVADDAPLPAEGPVIVSLVRWQAERDALTAAGRRVGVRLAAAERVEAIADDLARLALVALEFPAFRDGRAYSKARILRERHGFTGQIRAVGNVLRDQFLFMHRCGFDALEVTDAAEAEAWQAELTRFSVFFQPAADDGVPAPQQRLRAGRSAAE